MGADGFIRDVARAALDTIVDGNLADGAEGFVVKSRNAESGTKFFIELAQIFQMRGEGGELDSFVGQQKFLVAGVPQPGELALDHDGRQNRELVPRVGTLAKFGAAAVFFDADDTARAADGKPEGSEAFDGLRIKALFDIPHGATRLKKAATSVKRPDGANRIAILGRFGCMLRGLGFEFGQGVPQ